MSKMIKIQIVEKLKRKNFEMWQNGEIDEMSYLLNVNSIEYLRSNFYKMSDYHIVEFIEFEIGIMV